MGGTIGGMGLLLGSLGLNISGGKGILPLLEGAGIVGLACGLGVGKALGGGI